MNKYMSCLLVYLTQKSLTKVDNKGNNKYLLMIRSSCLTKLSIYMVCSFSIGLESNSNFVDEPAKEKHSV
jgi:hypothetical protein